MPGAMGSRGIPKNPEEQFIANHHAAAGAEHQLDPTVLAKRSTKERHLAKKRRIQADKQELKQHGAASASFATKIKGDGKASGRTQD